jgi:hypothetical protein
MQNASIIQIAEYQPVAEISWDPLWFRIEIRDLIWW